MYSAVHTGNVLLSAWRNVVGNVIRFATHCKYHHTTVAVRINPDTLSQLQIISTGGILCQLENRISTLSKHNCTYKCIIREIDITHK